jgi:phosphoglycerate dehydrogenase-like enzyme
MWSPLVSQPALIATPHVAGATRDSLMASAQRLVENVRRLDSGGGPHWIRN